MDAQKDAEAKNKDHWREALGLPRYLERYVKTRPPDPPNAAHLSVWAPGVMNLHRSEPVAWQGILEVPTPEGGGYIHLETPFSSSEVGAIIEWARKELDPERSTTVPLKVREKVAGLEVEILVPIEREHISANPRRDCIGTV